jgi:adenine phosphoribosyltransferase
MSRPSRSNDRDQELPSRVRARIRDVPDFPAPGILFRDITPLLADAALFRDVTDAMAAAFAGANVTHVAGIESRGFVLAAPVAQRLRAGFIPIRKRGKLPWSTIGRDYGLEYGSDQLEIHVDACPPGSRVLVVDDVLATGGTACASAELIQAVGGDVVGFSFLIALDALRGAARLAPHRADTLLNL